MGDKRSVHTDALETLGNIIDDTARRDAIHIAVEPVVAGENLYPGQDIGLVNGKASTKAKKLLGIVDPFLVEKFVPEGQMCWMLVYPRTITSLRHVWSHPEFEETKEKNDLIQNSINWITSFADNIDLTYQQMLEYADNYIKNWECIVGYGSSFGDNWNDDFWHHYEIVTGKIVPKDKRHSFFSCSC